MSDQNQDKQVNQGAAIAGVEIKEGSKYAKKTGKKLAKTGKNVFMMLPFEAKLIVVAIVLVLIIFGIFVNGLNSSSMKRVTRQNAIGINNYSNNPTTNEEKYDAIYNKDIAVEDTINLVKVIHEVKQEDYADLNTAIEKAVKRKARDLGVGVDIEASVSQAKYEAADSSGLAYLTGSDLLDGAGLSPDDYVTDSVVIGEAIKGEAGKRGQKAGDQTGKEVATSSYGSGWDYALRAKSDITKLKLAEAMKNACDNKHIGYDLDDRGSLYSEANIKEWNLKMIDRNVETAGPDLINACLMYAGINKRYAPMYSTAANIRKALNETGKFEKKKTGESDAMPGDILINEKAGRAAIVISSENRVELELPFGGSSSGGTTINPESFVSDKTIVGEATSDERGKTKGGKAGDQTGDEVATRGYYHNDSYGNWIYVFRAKDPAARLKIADAVLKSCENSHIGYDQSNRKTAFKEGEKVGFQMDQVATDCETTCSELANLAIASAGLKSYLPTSYTATFGTLDKKLLKSSEFMSIKLNRASLQPGDILMSRTHTCIVVKSPNKVPVTGAVVIGGFSGASSGSAFQQGVIKWVKDTVALKKYGYKVFENPPSNRSKCPICHPGSGDGWNCIGFAWASWHHGGKIDSSCWCGVIDDGRGDRLLRMSEKEGAKMVSERAGVEVKIIKNGGSTIPASMLQAGDILLMYEGSTYVHMVVYIGNGEFGESGRYNGPNSKIRISKYPSSGDGAKVAIRYAGSGGGAAAGYTKKTSMTVLQEISSDTGNRDSIGYINGTSANCAQSFAYVNGNYAVAFVTSSNSPSYVQVYDKSGRVQGRVRNDSINHANGACSTPDDKLLVAGAMNPGSGTGHFFNVDSNVSSAGSKSLPSNASAIAYDKETQKYILATSGTIRVYDSTMSTMEKSFSRNMHGRYYQDIGAGYGFVFACHTESKGRENSGSNYIDIYNESNGDYCGSYHLDYGELESCDVVDGELVLLVHILGYTNYIHHTGIMVSEEGGAGYNSEMITKLDMDILSAYNASISNTSMWLTERKYIQDVKEDWLDKKGYRDASGRSVSLYWFGKNRGQINYEKDLKKKIDTIFKFNKGSYESSDSKHFFKIVVGDSTENYGGTTILPVTVKEAEVEDLMSPMFGLTPKDDYVNSMAEKAAKRKQADKEKENIKASEYYSVFKLDKGSATNLDAIYSISDMTGKMLFGDLSPVPKGAGYADGNQVQGPGSLRLPLPAGSFTVTSHVGYRDDVQGVGSSDHKGVDLAAPTGTPIYASLAGEVTTADWYGGYGNCVIIKSGNIDLIYGHMSKILCSKGDKVKAGQIIGQVGSTGNSTGPHLHFEMHKDGKVVDPEPLLGLK